jgi:hypothetical protein
VVQEGGRRCKKSTLNDLVHPTPLRIPLMNPPMIEINIHHTVCKLQRSFFFNVSKPRSAQWIVYLKEVLKIFENFKFS